MKTEIKKICRIPNCNRVGKPQGRGKRASLCRRHYNPPEKGGLPRK